MRELNHAYGGNIWLRAWKERRKIWFLSFLAQSLKIRMKVTSKNNVPIRLTGERWAHITESHDYMAGCMDHVSETIDDPDYIVGGPGKELIALRYYQDLGKHVVVV